MLKYNSWVNFVNDTFSKDDMNGYNESIGNKIKKVDSRYIVPFDFEYSFTNFMSKKYNVDFQMIFGMKKIDETNIDMYVKALRFYSKFQRASVDEIIVQDFEYASKQIKRYINLQKCKDSVHVYIPLSIIPEFKSLLIKLMDIIPGKINIIEVGSGNNANSCYFERVLSSFRRIKSFIKTDIYDYEIPGNYVCNSETAITKYGQESNILLLICPPVYSYMDYFAIKEFEKTPMKKKFIIYIGDIGISDGSPEIYQYLQHGYTLKLANGKKKVFKKWNVVFHKSLTPYSDVFADGHDKEMLLCESN